MSSGQLVKPKAVASSVKLIQKEGTKNVKRERSNSGEDFENAEIDRKKMKGDIGEKQEDGSIVFDLSSKKQVTVRSWKKAILVDIREYYDSNGERKPGKKGISLTKDQWKNVIKSAYDIDNAVEWVKNPDGTPASYSTDTIDDVEENTVAFSISAKRRATIRKFKSMILIDFREYYDSNETMKPGQKGISLSMEQWTKLRNQMDAINDAMEVV